MIPKNNDIRFEVTTCCNYNCIICPRDKLTRKIETMHFGLFKRLLDKILSETTQYDTLTFSGLGEQLLDKTLDKKIRYAKKKRIKDILIVTNGSLLSIRKFKEFEAMGVTSIRVSFYGNNAESYSKVHGVNDKNMFKILKDNLTKISAIRKNTKLNLAFNVVDGSNDGCMTGWVDYWKDKVDLLEVWRLHNWANGRDYRKIQEKKLNTCGRPFRGPLQVQVDGTINMCCYDFDGKLTLGGLKKQTLEEIFSSTLYKKIIEHHTSGDFKNSKLICEKCDQRNSDKSDAIIYSSKFDIRERVKQTSTTYSTLI